MQVFNIQTTIPTPVTQLVVNTLVVVGEKDAVIIDPAAPLSAILSATKDKHVVAILLTHAHWDHVLTLMPCLSHFGCPCYMHPLAQGKLNNPDFNCSSTHNLSFTLDPSLIPNKVFLPLPHSQIAESVPLKTQEMGGSQKKRKVLSFPNSFTFLPLSIGEFDFSYVCTPGHSDCSVSYFLANHLFVGDTLRLVKQARTNLPTGSEEQLQATLAFFRTLPPTMLVFNGHDTPSHLASYHTVAK